MYFWGYFLNYISSSSIDSLLELFIFFYFSVELNEKKIERKLAFMKIRVKNKLSIYLSISLANVLLPVTNLLGDL